eukprot:g47816.t1
MPLFVLSIEQTGLQNRLEEAQIENMKIKQMNELLEQKAATLATELVDVKAKFDDEKSHRNLAEMRRKALMEELEKERTKTEELQSELRPGLEDVAVLKKELVQVQTLMDQMSLEQERRSDKLTDENEQLKVQRNTAEASVTELKAELARVQQENTTRCEEVRKIQQECEEMKKKNQ